MAIFRLQINSLSRSAGRRATSAAAYRAGERIKDERSGDVHNFSRRTDIMHTEIFLPEKLGHEGAQWARDRASLWNAAEQAENRRTARVAREFQVNLPSELSAQQRLSLARVFSQELADRYGIAIDLAVHQPRPDGDPRNFHAHLLGTTREVTSSGLGAKAGLDIQPKERERLGLASASQEFTNVRARWATLTNEALREAGIDARVDHRSLAAQGITREPMPHLSSAALEERSRGGSEATGPRSLEEIRRDAAKAWLQMRLSELDQSEPRTAAIHEPSPHGKPETREHSPEPTIDDDFLP